MPLIILSLIGIGDMGSACHNGNAPGAVSRSAAWRLRYGESWRVRPEESLLSVCGERVERGNAGRPFYAKDLEPSTYQRTRAVCAAAGVKEGPLLDACTLDVAVIGNDAAAKVFVGARDPSAVGIIITSGGITALFGAWWWWLLLLLLVLLVIVVILWIVRKKKKTP